MACVIRQIAAVLWPTHNIGRFLPTNQPTKQDILFLHLIIIIGETANKEIFQLPERNCIVAAGIVFQQPVGRSWPVCPSVVAACVSFYLKRHGQLNTFGVCVCLCEWLDGLTYNNQGSELAKQLNLRLLGGTTGKEVTNVKGSWLIELSRSPTKEGEAATANQKERAFRALYKDKIFLNYRWVVFWSHLPSSVKTIQFQMTGTRRPGSQSALNKCHAVADVAPVGVVLYWPFCVNDETHKKALFRQQPCRSMETNRNGVHKNHGRCLKTC